MRALLLAALLLGPASQAGAQVAPTTDRGLWGRIGLTGGLASRTGDAYGSGIAFGIDLAAGAKRNRHTLLGGELDLRFVVGHDGSDYQGIGYGASLLGVLTRYGSAVPSFVQFGLGVGLDGEAADFSYTTFGPVGRVGIGFGSGVIAPTITVTAMLPVVQRDLAPNQGYGARFGVEVGLAFTFR